MRAFLFAAGSPANNKHVRDLSPRRSAPSSPKPKQQFLEAGTAGLVAGSSSRPSSREDQLAAQVEELTTALGEAHVELRVWKMSAEGRLAPSRTSR